MGTYSVVENGKQIATLASLYGAAKLWEENPIRRVLRDPNTTPSRASNRRPS